MSSTRTITQLLETPEIGQPANKADSINLPSIRLQASDATDTLTSEEVPVDAVEAIPDGGYGWTVIFSCSVMLFWINGYSTAWGVLQTAMVKSPQLHANVQTITFVGGLYMACLVAFGLVSVKVMAIFGARYTGLASVILFGLGLIATSFTLDNLGGLFTVAGVLVGVSTSILWTATNSLPVQWFSSRLGTANGLVKAGGGVGATVLPLVAQALIDRLGLPWTFRVLGFLVLATGMPCALLLKARVPTKQAARLDWSQLKSVPFVALTLSGAVGVFALFVPPFFLPLFASSIGLSTSTGAGLVAGFGASTAVGRLLSGWLCDRIGAFNTFAIAVILNTFSMLAIWPVSASLPPLVIFAVVNGCANGSFFVGLPTAVATLAPRSAAASISLATSFWTPGYLLGPSIAGILIEATGAAESSSIEPYRAAIFYASGIGVMTTLLVVLSRMRLETKLFKKL